MSVIAVRPGGFGSHLPHPLPPTHPFLWGGGVSAPAIYGEKVDCSWEPNGWLRWQKCPTVVAMIRESITAVIRFEGQPLPDSKDSLYQIQRTAFTRLRRTAFTRLRRTAFTRFEGQPLPDSKDSLYQIWRTAFTVYVWFIGQIYVNLKMPDMPYGYRCIHSNRDSLFKKKKIQIILEGRKKHSSYKVSWE